MSKSYQKLKRCAKLKRGLKRTWLYVMIKRMLHRVPVLSEQEEAIVNIVSQHLIDKESQLHIAPITGNRYIISSDGDLQIVLTPINAIITNSVYHYDIRLGADAIRLVYNKFDRIMESRCKHTESEIRGNMMIGLRKIAESTPR